MELTYFVLGVLVGTGFYRWGRTQLERENRQLLEVIELSRRALHLDGQRCADEVRGMTRDD